MSYRAAFLFPLLLATPAFAQDDGAAPAPAPLIDPAKLDGDSLRIGAAAGFTPSYDGSDDLVLTVVPGIQGRVSGINFALRGNRFYADIIPTRGGPGWDVQLGPIVSVNFNRKYRSTVTDPQVRRLPTRNFAIEVGGFAGIGKQGVITSDYDKLSVSVAYTYDVNGVHSSQSITPAIDYSTPLSTKAYVGLNLQANYEGQGFADAYFTITPADSIASGLPAYRAKKGWKDWTLSAFALHSLTGDLTGGLSLMAAGSYRRMLNDFGDSPVTSIAGSRDQWTGMLGLAYAF
ncbi:MipA/OmpV family protein [Sphingomonas sp. AOB5]|uniref:MipA/OmpV family protein n=1 Tax=Sphingomonas sp. AOB5 TaxID=3034017 RepID=UPI0023F89D0D|nr:MipA/OmpV family protein [Sphingomonas sp. AOB5]MDF7777740.1 MipA/OmpV family protein [Sphingomonas sp. AOB5]